jgi:hypothetical protein
MYIFFLTFGNLSALLGFFHHPSESLRHNLKMIFKKYLSLSQLMQEVPVNRGSRAFLACEKGRRRFTSLSQIWCETFVKRQKREKALESPVDREV